MLEMLARSEKNDSKNGNPWGGGGSKSYLVSWNPSCGWVDFKLLMSWDYGENYPTGRAGGVVFIHSLDLDHGSI